MRAWDAPLHVNVDRFHSVKLGVNTQLEWMIETTVHVCVMLITVVETTPVNRKDVDHYVVVD